MKIIAVFISLIVCTYSPWQNFEKLNFQEKDIEIKDNTPFAKFLSHFDKSKTPLLIDHSVIRKYKSTISSKPSLIKKSKSQTNDGLKNFLPIVKQGEFSRMGAPIVTPIHRFYPDENTIAVTYLVYNRFGGAGFSVMLSLFDLRGNHITNTIKDDNINNNAIMIAQLTPYKTVLCSSGNSGVIGRTTYKNIWKKDINEFGIQGNTITNYKREASEILTLLPDGKIAITDIERIHICKP